ncbi:hypothetical protein PFISCL1PPCAC_9091, partial [Pristionchus fissidentatus]
AAGIYCFDNMSPADGETGLLILAEVALGRPNRLMKDCRNVNKPETDSNQAVGQYRPNPQQEKSFAWVDGKYIPYPADENAQPVKVPCGNPVELKEGWRTTYNEFVAFNTEQ